MRWCSTTLLSAGLLAMPVGALADEPGRNPLQGNGTIAQSSRWFDHRGTAASRSPATAPATTAPSGTGKPSPADRHPDEADASARSGDPGSLGCQPSPSIICIRDDLSVDGR